MKQRILARLFYHVGDLWSHIMCWSGFGYRFYNWAMNKSVEYDIDCRLWKPAPEYKMARYRTAALGKKRKKKSNRRRKS